MPESPKRTITKKLDISVGSIVLFIVAFLALAGIVSSAGKYISAPLQTGEGAHEVVSQSFSDQGGVIVDDSSTRVLFLDTNRQIRAIVQTEVSTEVQYFFGASCAADDGIYVQRYCYFPNSDYIKQGQVVKYGYDGKMAGVIAQFDLDQTSNRLLQPLITSLSVEDGTCYACICNPISKHVALVAFSTQVTDTPCGLGQGTVYSWDDLRDDIDVAYAKYDRPNNRVYFIDQLGRAYTATVGQDEFQSVTLANSAAGLVDLDLTTQPPTALSKLSCDGETFSYGPVQAMRLHCFWASVVLALLVLLHFLVCGFISVVLHRNYLLLKRTGVVIAVIAVASVIVGFYSYNLYLNQQSAKVRTLSTACSSLRQSEADTLRDAVQTFQSNGSLTAGVYNDVSDLLESQTLLAAKNESEAVYSLVAIRDGKSYLLADSSHSDISGTEVDGEYEDSDFEQLFGDNPNPEVAVVSTSRNDRGRYIVAACCICDDNNNVIGALVAGDSVVLTSAKNIQSLLGLFITLIIAFIVVSFVVVEARAWLKCFLERRRRLKAKSDTADFCLVRPIYFLSIGALSCDTALVTLIATDMIADTPMAGNTLIIMLPALFTALGCLLATVIYSVVMPRVGAKRVLVCGAIVGVVGFIGAAISVLTSNIVWLSVCLVIPAAGIQTVVIAMGATSMHSAGEDSYKVSRDRSAASASSGALVALIASYLAQNIGNWTVYALAAAISILLVIFLAVLFPRTSVLDRSKLERAGKKGSGQGMAQSQFWTLFRRTLSPLMIAAIVTVGLSLSLMGGYKSFVFPLIAYDAGFNKTDVAEVVIFCNALTYYLAPAGAAARSKFGPRKVIIAAVMMLSALLLVNLVNFNVVWAVVVLIAGNAIQKAAFPCIRVTLQNHSYEVGASKESAVSIGYAVNSILDTARAPVIGAVSLTGGVVTCAILGCYFCVSGAAFWAGNVISRKMGQRRQQLEAT